MGSLPTNGTPSSPGSDQQRRHALYLVGQNVTHTIAPPMHDHIANHLLHLPDTWSFTPQECPSVTDAVAMMRRPDFAGSVVTMPYKKTIMPLLDELDELCLRIGACNGVYLVPGADGERRLRGTNTDWRGIKGCLLGASSGTPSGGRPALIIGAGGASRAAVYALGVEMGLSPIYIINRDEQEVRDLVADVAHMRLAAEARREIDIIHVRSVEQARQLERPYYVVGTVPDFEPQTAEEKRAREMLEGFFLQTSFVGEGAENGVFLDMCFKPRVTRQIKLARRYGWRTVEGTEIIGHQIEEQWRLWTGQTLTPAQQAEAWRVLRRAAEESKAINF
jgi:quinate dehydrogenase